MKILLINQTYYPDVSATSQYLTDLSLELVRGGHNVTVFTGNRSYENPKSKYSAFEIYQGVKIHRLPYLGLGKASKLFRILDLLSFFCMLFFRLVNCPKQDVVMSLTTPPLAGLFGGWFCKLKGGRHLLWVMDVNPDEAVAAKWICKGSLFEKLLTWISKKTYALSDAIVVLDEFMQSRIIQNYVVGPNKVYICPPWALDDQIHVVGLDENGFRAEHAFEKKFVVMYSGNHSVCHPLDTLLQAALLLKDHEGIIFCFVGGGVRTRDVADFKKQHGLSNIVQIPYQPLAKLAQSLSAADLHVMVMGAPFVGIVHPCKIYGILGVGRPFVVIGPSQSSAGQLVKQNAIGFQVEQSDVAGLLKIIEEVRGYNLEQKQKIERDMIAFKDQHFSKAKLSQKFLSIVENLR